MDGLMVDGWMDGRMDGLIDRSIDPLIDSTVLAIVGCTVMLYLRLGASVHQSVFQTQTYNL